ncbi:glycosyltransferase family 2 protein [Acidobacteria bacterium AH-259-D05]|nr:glycosyltransferase family 2 protein [Acidobacteria bacterium AH-259-D05]
MYVGHSVGIVLPAFNEERLLGPTIDSVPDWVDRIYVVDDASTDGTMAVARRHAEKDPRVCLIQHEVNQGPGGAIISGYRRAVQDSCDLVVGACADNQMPLDEIPRLLDPLVNGKADYVKGNRFMDRNRAVVIIPQGMPRIRVFGNILITALTKIASGYYSVADVVEGFTAITREAIKRVDWSKAWQRYGYPMGFLILLNAFRIHVVEVPRTAIYLPGERQTQIKPLSYIPSVAPMLLRGFFWRLWNKYVLWDFHPLVFFYISGLILLPAGILYGLYLVWQQWVGIGVSGPRAVLCALLIITGFQFLLFAMLFDMEEGR